MTTFPDTWLFLCNIASITVKHFTVRFLTQFLFPSNLQLHSNSDKGDGSVRYILSGEGAGSIFIIDEISGDIHAAESLDRETKSQYVLHARAVDRWTNRSLEAESDFIIKVQDVNDNAPKFPDGPFSASVAEMSDVGKSRDFSCNNTDTVPRLCKIQNF